MALQPFLILDTPNSPLTRGHLFIVADRKRHDPAKLKAYCNAARNGTEQPAQIHAARARIQRIDGIDRMGMPECLILAEPGEITPASARAVISYLERCFETWDQSAQNSALDREGLCASHPLIAKWESEALALIEHPVVTARAKQASVAVASAGVEEPVNVREPSRAEPPLGVRQRVTWLPVVGRGIGGVLLLSVVAVTVFLATRLVKPKAIPAAAELAVRIHLRRFAVVCNFPEEPLGPDHVKWARNFYSEMNSAAGAPSAENIFKALEESPNVEIFLDALPSLGNAPPREPSDEEYQAALQAVAQADLKNRTAKSDDRWVQSCQDLLQFRQECPEFHDKPFASMATFIRAWQQAILTYGYAPGVGEGLQKKRDDPAKMSLARLSTELSTGYTAPNINEATTKLIETWANPFGLSKNQMVPPDSSHPLKFVTVKDCLRWVAIDAFLAGNQSSNPTRETRPDAMAGNLSNDLPGCYVAGQIDRLTLKDYKGEKWLAATWCSRLELLQDLNANNKLIRSGTDSLGPFVQELTKPLARPAPTQGTDR